MKWRHDAPPFLVLAVCITTFVVVGSTLFGQSAQFSHRAGVKVATVPRFEVPDDSESPLIDVAITFLNGYGSTPLRDVHFRPLYGKIQAVPAAPLPVGWTFARGRFGGVSIFAPASDAPTIGPGEAATFVFAPSSPNTETSTDVRWYATATGQPTTPPLTPRRRPRGPQPASTPRGPGPAPGGTTPYGGGVVDYGPRQAMDPATALPVARVSIPACGEDGGPCPIVLDPGTGSLGLGVGASGLDRGCLFVVLVRLDLGPLLELDLLDPENLAYSPFVRVDLEGRIGGGGAGSFTLTPTTGLEPPIDLELAIIVDDDGDGFFEPAWDLVSAVYPVQIR